MITLKQKADSILSYIRDGKNISEIARETGSTEKQFQAILKNMRKRRRSS